MSEVKKLVLVEFHEAHFLSECNTGLEPDMRECVYMCVCACVWRREGLSCGELDLNTENIWIFEGK